MHWRNLRVSLGEWWGHDKNSKQSSQVEGSGAPFSVFGNERGSCSVAELDVGRANIWWSLELAQRPAKLLLTQLHFRNLLLQWPLLRWLMVEGSKKGEIGPKSKSWATMAQLRKTHSGGFVFGWRGLNGDEVKWVWGGGGVQLSGTWGGRAVEPKSKIQNPSHHGSVSENA